MNLERFLKIGAVSYELTSEQVILELSAAGRATFTIIASESDITPFSPVAFDINYSRFDTLQRFFLGYVESVVKVDNKQVSIFCREMSAVLSIPMPLSLRHPTLNDVLQAVSDFSDGLKFVVVDSEYAKTKIPHFSNIGSGYNALNALGKAFKIPDYIWRQQDDGSIFVGSWEDADYDALDIPDDLLDSQLSSNSANVLAIPFLRPGILFNDNRLKRVEFAGNMMTVDW